MSAVTLQSGGYWVFPSCVFIDIGHIVPPLFTTSVNFPPAFFLQLFLHRQWSPLDQFNQVNDFRDFPNMGRNASFHRGSDAQCLVYPAKVVMHEVKHNGVFMVLNLLAESVHQAQRQLP